MPVAAPARVIDALNALLEAEVNSVFRFISDGSPYLSRATAEVRKPMSDCGQLSRQHAQELADMITSLGGVPLPRQLPRMEDQYMAYLSLKFLLPKLVKEKELIIMRYDNARRAIGDGFPELAREITRIEDQQTQYLQALKKAAHDITGGRYAKTADPSAPVKPGPKGSDAGPSAD